MYILVVLEVVVYTCTMKQQCILMGVDPGSRHTGYACIDVSSTMKLCTSGRISPKASLPFSERLTYIFLELQAIMEEYSPTLVSIEDVHVAQNARSALRLGQARGVVIASCATQAIPIFDCTPSLVKKTMTSYGGASKEQVAFMVKKIFAVDGKSADETDAIAIALCGYHYAPQFSILAKALVR